ncbi:hypothetical protein AMS68_002169 [Peltaster fructicola]|uniref:Presequence protease, mitochondrial n=1 Tax=Peltaster fructicola TaxID=286661 RepID=A0A6H0XPG1_9PEZI|nr:hypothetical protein AMS68_002169 [Peltaster fructicola]
MLPRSLNNFMNAFTSADYTMYLIATTNKTDYRNLMTMYLDATLHPLLKQFDFLQEGWRVGPENPQAAAGSPGGDLVFKGVVYNEMKGQFSDASYLYYMRWLQHIFPSLNFYGGDPQKITDLTWEQLKQFHADHYHPSNSRIITYGNTPLEEHLTILGPELDRFSRIDVDTDIKMPISLDAGPLSIEVEGQVDPMLPEDAQNKLSMTWLMGDTKDIQESFALRIATTLLLDGYGSPAYKALIESGLGTDYAVNTGYDTSSAKGIFSLGVNGVADADVAKVQSAIKNVIRDVCKTGFDDHKIQGLLHQLELGLKNKTPGFGLDIINRLTPGWFNGIAPLHALSWNSIVDAFKTRYAQGGYLESLLEKYLANDKYFSFHMRPSSQYANVLVEDEQERLKSKIANVVKQTGADEAADKYLRDQEIKLLEVQEGGRKESLDCLPTLRVSDIPRQQTKVELSTEQLPSYENVSVQWRRANTNGLTYFRAIAPFTLNDELRPLLPLFFDSLARIGTANKSMEQLEDEIKLKTGGISFAYHSSPSPTDFHTAEEGLLISGYALDRNVTSMYDLTRTLLMETDFASAKAKSMIKQLLQASASGAIDGIAESGHAYARRSAESGLSVHGHRTEQISGITQVENISRLALIDENSQDMDVLVSKLVTLQQFLAAHLALSTRVALTCGADNVTENEHSLTQFFDGLSSSTAAASSIVKTPSTTTTKAKTFFNLPYQVYYSGLALPTYSYSDARGAPLAVLAQLLTHKHLHHEVREKGGAYGAGAYSKGLSGTWGMYSYRDPNPENTLKVMYDAGNWARERSWSDGELEEAKLSLFQSIDAPQAVSEEGMVNFVSGIDQEMEQVRRELILDVSKTQVKEAADWIAQQLASQGEKLVVLGEKKAFVDGAWTINDMKRV